MVIVDDDPIVLRSLARLLDDSPFNVESCLTPHDVLRHVSSGDVRVVVSDLSMPEITGIELLRMIRQYDPDLPVVLITGQSSLESATEAIEYGAFRYLIKPVNPETFVSTVERAARLYQLAQSKRQAITFFGDGAISSERLGLETSFERALNQMWIAFQPIVRASDRSIFGYEALLRSDEPSMREPEPILNAAERLGALEQLGRAVRKKAADSILAAHRPYALFVNLHPRDLLDPELVDDNASLAPIAGRVVFEVTERAAISDVESARATVARLRERGFRIAVDDLGAGYAGLNSFALLEPEFVKLDMSLIRNVDTSTVKQKVVRSLTSLSREMGLFVVAEGIETRAERDAAIELGCDLLQGYLFARPGPGFASVQW